MASTPTPLELKAADIVSKVTGVSWVALDPGGGSRPLADLGLLDGDGTSIGVLEVTTTTRQHRVAIQKQFAALDWGFPELRYNWSITTRDSSVDARLVHAAIRSVLPQLERSGDVGDWIPSVDSGIGLPDSLTKVGVVQVIAYEPVEQGGSGFVSIGPTFGGGFYSLDALRLEAQGALDRPDNQLKLNVTARRSELFVWLDVGAGQVALSTVHVPPFDEALATMTAPSLPPGCTGVWLASPGGDASWPASYVVFGNRGGWTIVRRPLGGAVTKQAI